MEKIKKTQKRNLDRTTAFEFVPLLLLLLLFAPKIVSTAKVCRLSPPEYAVDEGNAGGGPFVPSRGDAKTNEPTGKFITD